MYLTPLGHLLLESAEKAPVLNDKVAARLAGAFEQDTGHGLLQLGAGEVGQPLPPTFMWWRDFSIRFVEAVCLHASSGAVQASSSRILATVPALNEGELATLLLSAPMMTGAEYLSADVLLRLWDDLGAALVSSLEGCDGDLQSFMQGMNPSWNLIGRVHFNLAVNRKDPDHPFAFMATYTTRLSTQAKLQHMPLGRALSEYAGAANRDKLLSLLVPVQRAALGCSWLKTVVESGEVFHPLRWSASQASRFLNSAPLLEDAGVILRMPANWSAGRPKRPQVTATVGGAPAVGAGLEALLDFQMSVVLGDEALSEDEIASLLAGTEALVLLRGEWVEIDRQRLESTMRQFTKVQDLADSDGLTFSEAMRLLSSAAINDDDQARAVTQEWANITAGTWLADTLSSLRNVDGASVEPGPALKGKLRPYQKVGVEWLHLLSGLGLGACLADDMGLGKTIQVLSLLLIQKEKQRQKGSGHKPSLLVAPASLLANWAAESRLFSPDLRIKIMHSSAMMSSELKRMGPDELSAQDLVITSYGSLLRMPVLSQMPWRYLVLDEAQAIKNPKAKQTVMAKALISEARIALTGTPVENNLSDLWSIFDFINPGLLGNITEFSRYIKKLTEREHNPYGPLRDLVRPYILRRMKTDKKVITDLPEKTEIKALCTLSHKQAALYGQTVTELTAALKEADGIQRKGIVLATLMRLKQICNHPSQWLKDSEWSEGDSGKWARLREITQVVAARQEKMLVFTQFREMTEPLAAFLGEIFGRPGLVLHGGTSVKSRKGLVQTFQENEMVPFMVLSLKAGGAGLTLTAASHVVHVDRWWNPSVENQATDRAFRIGQKKNVLVHKFVCQGTIEEKIDTLIEAKKELSDDVLCGGKEINLTEIRNEDLLRMVALDLKTAMEAC
ncbi:DEAD/DEAH box helicase [Pseudovibrio sp. Tun.PSC04-5.I4]|uniref:DEAD/DEAH box helicase n=1 Tax=Pseudovibrio sp. Tun.PSC04-5.I4 TaxID=1798213 RepID=UPI001FCAA43A|nr:DEAD/DEAH box helicase [Pseudovibrio sp. Tun.PSC04-5.I4]